MARANGQSEPAPAAGLPVESPAGRADAAAVGGLKAAPGLAPWTERTEAEIGVDLNLGSIDQDGHPGRFSSHFERATADPRIGWSGSGAPGAMHKRLWQEAHDRFGIGNGNMNPYDTVIRFSR